MGFWLTGFFCARRRRHGQSPSQLFYEGPQLCDDPPSVFFRQWPVSIQHADLDHVLLFERLPRVERFGFLDDPDHVAADGPENDLRHRDEAYAQPSPSQNTDDASANRKKLLSPSDRSSVRSGLFSSFTPTEVPMSTQLALHKGARLIERHELDVVDPPPPTDTWFPLKHSTVLDRVGSTLFDAGYQIEKQALALTADGQRFFATLDLRTPIMDGVSLMIGIRNSTDKSMPIGFCAGERVFVCDNMAFSSEVVIARKHTRFGERRFNDALSRAVLGLSRYQAVAQARIESLRHFDLSEDAANSYLLQSAERGVVGWRLLPKVIEEWRNPKHEEFRPRTAWSLFNSFTEVFKDRQRTQPARAAAETIRLQKLLLPQYEEDVSDVSRGNESERVEERAEGEAVLVQEVLDRERTS